MSTCAQIQAQLHALTALLDSLRALLEALLACQALWLRQAPVFALPGAAQHMPFECLTFLQVLAGVGANVKWRSALRISVSGSRWRLFAETFADL